MRCSWDATIRRSTGLEPGRKKTRKRRTVVLEQDLADIRVRNIIRDREKTSVFMMTAETLAEYQ